MLVKRNDRNGAVFAGKTSVSVHVLCQKRYMNKIIVAHLKKATKPSTRSGKLRLSS